MPSWDIIVCHACVALVVLWLLVKALLSLGMIQLLISVKLHGLPVSTVSLLAMRLRRSPVRKIVQACVLAKKCGIVHSARLFEAHAMAGGSPDICMAVVSGLQRHGIDVSLDGILACDLAGYDLGEAVKHGLKEEWSPETFTPEGLKQKQSPRRP